MTSGLDLDALVADRVMGWKYVGYSRGLHIKLLGVPPAGEFGLEEVPRYSTSIEAAWDVVERFPYFHITQSKRDHERYSAEFETEPGKFFNYEGESAPHAICLAALRAKGVEF